MRLRPATNAALLMMMMIAVPMIPLAAAPDVVARQLTPPSAKGPKIGERAPDFKLPDTEGRVHELASYKDRILVIEWINPACPYVERHYRGSMQATYRRVKELAPTAAWIAIDSTHDATREKAKFWITHHKLEYPILLDPTGKTGRRYDARRTPQMYVIDKKGNLRYGGAIDDNQLGTRRPGEVTNHVIDAVRQIVADEPVVTDRKKPYGCSIKYRR